MAGRLFILSTAHTEEDIDQTVKVFADSLGAMIAEGTLDKASFNEPKQYPAGVDYVLINGAVVVDEGKHTGTLNGHALLRTIEQ